MKYYLIGSFIYLSGVIVRWSHDVPIIDPLTVTTGAFMLFVPLHAAYMKKNKLGKWKEV